MPSRPERVILMIMKTTRHHPDDLAIARHAVSREGEFNTDDRPCERVDPAHLAALHEGLDAERRGDIATDEEVRAAFARLRR